MEKKKRGRPKKIVEPLPIKETETEPKIENAVSDSFPVIEGHKAIEFISDNGEAILYKMDNGTTVWCPKNK